MVERNLLYINCLLCVAKADSPLLDAGDDHPGHLWDKYSKGSVDEYLVRWYTAGCYVADS